MNFTSFGRQARNQGRGRGGRGRGRGRNGGRGGRQQHGHHRHNNRNTNASNKNFNHAHFIESSGAQSATTFNVGIQGCSHGELDSIYEALEIYRDQKLKEADPNSAIDVLLCCGDVQTLRNVDDYHALAVPQKYKAMGDFHQYYSGAKVAPILTIMIGGNHESSNYLQELYYGGWVAPNIYYLGAAGVVNLCKWSADRTKILTLRIAGISGIYKSHDYKLGRFEAPPYNNSELRSVYHTRHFEVERLRAVSSSNYANNPIDIMISHDWPRGIEQHGDVNKLIQQKPFFKQEIESNSLGSMANEALLQALKPRFWFAAHLHVKFEATVHHSSSHDRSGDVNKDKNSNAAPDANEATNFIALESNEGICPNPKETNMESLTDQMTRFLSLDKCLPKRRHLHLLHVEPLSTRDVINSKEVVNGDHNKSWLEYDPTWLAVHRRTEDWSQKTHNRLQISPDEFEQAPITIEELQEVMNSLKASSSSKCDKQELSNPMAIPRNFVQTVRPQDPSGGQQPGAPRPMIGNPQTDELLGMLGMEHKITVPFQRDVNDDQTSCRAPLAVHDPFEIPIPNDDNEIDLDADDEVGADSKVNQHPKSTAHLVMPAAHHSVGDDNEIDLDTAEDAMNHQCINATDPGEINLDDIDAEAGDSVCYSSKSAVKRPRV